MKYQLINIRKIFSLSCQLFSIFRAQTPFVSVAQRGAHMLPKHMLSMLYSDPTMSRSRARYCFRQLQHNL